MLKSRLTPRRRAVQRRALARRPGSSANGYPAHQMAGQDPVHPTIRAFVHEIRARGYIEGRNLILGRRTAFGRLDRYSGSQSGLVTNRH
jgi:hypothetical protein